MKITEPSKANQIPNDKFWDIVKDSKSLKETYFLLGQAYPIKQTSDLGPPHVEYMQLEIYKKAVNNNSTGF